MTESDTAVSVEQTSPRPRRSRARRVARVVLVLVAIVGVVLAADRVRLWFSPGPTVGHWTSAEGLAEYTRAYDEVLAPLPSPTSLHDVVTTFGTVRVLEWEAEDDPGDPLLLLPGHSAGAPMWAENLEDLIGERTIFALDPIGDAGMSTQRTPLESFEEQADWIGETIDGLGLDRVHSLGHSFGGANAAIHALRYPRQLASVTLMEPVYVIRQMPMSAFFWATLTQLPLPGAVNDRALAEIGGVTVEEVRQRDPMSVMIDAGAANFSTALPLPRTLDDEEWRSIEVPLRVDVSGGHSLAGGTDAYDRMRELRGDDEIVLWPESTHSLPMDERAALAPQLLEFWDAHDGAE